MSVQTTNIVKKRRRFYTLLIAVALIAGLWIGAVRSSPPDIDLVRGVRPVYALYSRYPAGTPYTAYRIYNVHVPYDKAVLSVMNDPRTKGWKNTEMTYMRSVFASPDQKHYVYVSRGYMVETAKSGIGDLPEKARLAAYKEIISSAPDPHGWVTVTTDGTLGSGMGTMKFYGQKLTNRLSWNKIHSYATISPPVKSGTRGTWVDVTTGTTQMEGDGAEVDGFMSVDTG